MLVATQVLFSNSFDVSSTWSIAFRRIPTCWTRASQKKFAKPQRKDSRNSTGPKSQSGKLRTRTNAVKHGLLARNLQLESDDDREEFQQLLDQLTADYAPNSSQDELLVAEIASLSHRASRCARRLEVAFLAHEEAARTALNFFTNASNGMLGSRRPAPEAGNIAGPMAQT